MTLRTQTRPIHVGPVQVGGGAPISVQTMANVPTTDVPAVLAQIRRADDLGCDIFRVAVPDQAAAEALPELVAQSPLPLVADIHFDHRLALAAIEAGVAALRINPGNIGGPDRVRAVVEAARPRLTPIRIGVNGGSLEKGLVAKYGSATPEALVESALGHVRLLEELDYHEIAISVKASDIPRTIAAYRLLADRVPYPLHLGLTEAGTALRGTVTSCVALSRLLEDGIGDTIRISLTAPIEQEVRVGVELLRACGLRAPGAERGSPVAPPVAAHRSISKPPPSAFPMPLRPSTARIPTPSASMSPSWGVSSTAPAKPARPTLPSAAAAMSSPSTVTVSIWPPCRPRMPLPSCSVWLKRRPGEEPARLRLCRSQGLA